MTVDAVMYAELHAHSWYNLSRACMNSKCASLKGSRRETVSQVPNSFYTLNIHDENFDLVSSDSSHEYASWLAILEPTGCLISIGKVQQSGHFMALLRRFPFD